MAAIPASGNAQPLKFVQQSNFKKCWQRTEQGGGIFDRSEAVRTSWVSVTGTPHTHVLVNLVDVQKSSLI